jgi:tetratricopeptide (TPR) repeat protein
VPKLVVFRGDAVEKEIRLARKPLRIGRHERNDVVLDDSANGVSRFHAELRAEGANYFIVDLESRNGIWVNGRRVQGKAALTPGIPVTIGGFELTLEDDVSVNEFEKTVPPFDPSTVADKPAVKKEEAGRRSAPARALVSSFFANRRQVALWSGVGALLLLVTVGTFGVVRYVTRPMTVAEVPVPQEAPPPPPPTEPPVDPNKELIDQHLLAARAQIDARDYEGAVNEHLRPVLELEPENAAALAMKQDADEAIAVAAAAAAAAKSPAKPPPPPTEVDPETPGIPRRPDESRVEYDARVKRVQIEFANGKASLEKNEFVAALNHFRSVERDQPRYQGVDALITETTAKQRKVVEDDIKNGQTYEDSGRKRDARLFYRHALDADPSATVARNKETVLKAQMTEEANRIATRASTAAKLKQIAQAIELYQQIYDQMLPGDEARDNAAEKLKELKR